MWNDEIFDVLKKFPSFVGVFSSDELPPVKKYPASFVMNTKPSSHPGEHWVSAFFRTPHYCEYFDSAGLPPVEGDIKRWLHENGEFVRYSSTMLQDTSPTSNACGHFCIAFIALKVKGLTLEEIIHFFSGNKPCNDQIAKTMASIFDSDEWQPKPIKRNESIGDADLPEPPSQSKSVFKRIFSRNKK